MELHKLAGGEQRIISAYHLQSNGLAECQNKTIKNSLEKVIGNNPFQWSYIVEGILFAHLVSGYFSALYSSFAVMYNCELVLSKDLEFPS